MSKQALRIFQEMPLIEGLLHQSTSEYDIFVTCLYAIAQNMTFNDWQDFWLDMGIRIYDAEEEWHTDFTDYDENDNELNEFHELY